MKFNAFIKSTDTDATTNLFKKELLKSQPCEFNQTEG